MKNKILKTFLFFVLFSALFVTASFATTNCYTSVKEDVSTYESTTYIIGSTRIDSNITITAGVAMNAGYNDAKVKLLLGQDIFNTKPAMYSYDTDFEEWTEVKEDGTTKLLTSSEVEELEDNLNIFFVNNDEKVLGVPYEGTVDEGSIINPYTGEKETNVKHENNTFYVKALTFEFMFTSNGVNNFVDTNIDTNIQEGKEPTVENMDIIPEGTAITVGKEFFEADQLKEAIEKSTPENEVKIWDYIELDSSVVLEKENMNAVLNLNWNSLNTSNANYVIELKAPNSVLTIKNGSIHGNKYGAIKVDSKDLNGASATLNLEETTSIQGFDYGLVIFGSKTTANIAGSVYANNVDGYAISGNGNSGWGGTTLNITGNAYISSSQGIGIYIPQDGVTNINGENVYIYGKTAIAMKAGELNVINGTLEGYGPKIQVPEETNDGTVGTGDAIYVESNEGYAGNVKINISEDANLNSMCGAPIRVYKSSSTADIKVTGRDFILDVDKTGKIIAYTDEEAAIAVGNINFSENSLQYVLNSYNDGTTIKLLKDIELAEGVEVTGTATLNLNGKTLKANEAMTSYALIKVDGGNLTINGEGTVNSASKGNDYSMAVWVTGTGVATINGGTYTNVGARAFEVDGTTPNNNELIYANGSGKIYINGGTFTGNTENITHGVKFTLNLKDNSEATITVKGGTFTGYDPANSKSENPTANLVAEGYRSVYDEVTNTYTVKAYDINNVDDDDSLKYALANAKEGDTINLAAGNYSKVLIDYRKKVAKNITLVGTEGVNVAGVNMNGANYGFVPEGLTLKNITFTDDVIVNNTDKWGSTCKNLSIIECTFSNASFSAGSNSIIDGLTIKNNKFNGTNETKTTSILLQGGHINVLVEGNIIDGSSHNAVQCTGVSGKTTIVGNTMKNIGSRAMRITTATGAELTISNNIISNVNTVAKEAEENMGQVIKITGTVISTTAEGNTYNGEALNIIDGIATIPVVE